MEVTVLGSGIPVPTLDRAGTGIAIRTGDEVALLDCGQMVLRRLVEHEFDITEIQTLFFTHHHPDHNLSFHEIAFLGWFLGRRSLTVYGPPATEDLVEGFVIAHRAAIESLSREPYRRSADLFGMDVRPVTDGVVTRFGDAVVSSIPVHHTTEELGGHLETFAYRFDEPSSRTSFAFTGDTSPIPQLADFVEGVDLLIHEATRMSSDEPLADESPESYREHPFVPKRYTTGAFEWFYRTRFERGNRDLIGTVHSNPAEAAAVAAEAGVKHLVLTHFAPYRDIETIRREAESVYDGPVTVASDGLRIPL